MPNAIVSILGFNPSVTWITKTMELRKITILESTTVWSGRGDLNARPPAPKAGALPGCATPRLCTYLILNHFLKESNVVPYRGKTRRWAQTVTKHPKCAISVIATKTSEIKASQVRQLGFWCGLASRKVHDSIGCHTMSTCFLWHPKLL